ncbi:MAG: zinc ribbon domain-containing protein [Dehalococcoidales bacterium]|nr:zinc ribbon domain-containing protein [Dehalococcoidales bacterium]
MPIYEFECKKCHHKFDLKRGYGEFQDAVCPACKGKAPRCFSAVPVIFKGSGFYITDHRKPEASEGGSSAPSTKTAAPNN